jgi:hypothetical protein
MFSYMVFFMNFFFFRNGLCRFDFIFFILSWLRILLCRFFFKTLWIVTVFPHMIFVLLQCFHTCFFKKKLYLSNFFFNIELVENLALTFPACFSFHFFSFCFCFFFPKLSLFFFRIVFVDFIFLIWS